MKTERIIKILFAALMLCLVRCTDTNNNEGLDDALNKLLLEKTERAGYYKAAALQAEKAGNAEVATYLGEIAEEERTHAAKLAVMQAAVKTDTKKNLGALIKMEQQSAKSEYPELIALAKEEGNDSLSTLLKQIQADDTRHALGLKGILERVK